MLQNLYGLGEEGGGRSTRQAQGLRTNSTSRKGDPRYRRPLPGKIQGQTSGFFPLRALSEAVLVGSLGQENGPPLCKGSALAFPCGLILSSSWPENRAIADSD